MKKILFILLFLIPTWLLAQDYEAWELPEYTAVENDSTDVLYLDDSGVDKHLEMPVLLDVVHDSVEIVRSALIDTATAIRAGIGGAGIWDRTGNYTTLHTSADSVGIGIASPTYKLHTVGNSYFNGFLFTDTLRLNVTNQNNIYSSLGEMYFEDINNTPIRLTQLTRGPFSLAGTLYYNATYYPSALYNWRLGGTGTTTYKLDITGTLHTSTHIYNGGYLYFAGLGGGFGSPHPGLYAYGDTLTLFDESGTWSLTDLTTGGTGTDSAAVIGLIGDVLDTTDFTFSASYNADMDTILGKDEGDMGFMRIRDLWEVDTLRFNSGNTYITKGTSANLRVQSTATAPDYLLLMSGGANIGIYTVDQHGITSDGSKWIFATSTNEINKYYFDGTYWRSATDTLADRDYARSQGGAGATGDVKVSGTTTNHYTAYWNGTDSTLVADGAVKIYADSISLSEYTNANDTLYFKYLAGDPDNWLYATVTGGADTGTTVDADTLLRHPLPTLKEQLEDIQNGEMAWYIVDKKNNTVWKNYGLKGVGLGNRLNAYMGMAEVNLRYTRGVQEELETEKEKNKALENRLIILEAIIANQIKLNQ